jgi:phytoene desaturase
MDKTRDQLRENNNMNTSEQKSILVIGAGLGGIAAAARLAKEGYRVTVLEKNKTPGGRCNQLIKDGHRFDIGPTLYLMPDLFEDTYSALGESVPAHLDLRRIDPTYHIRWNDGMDLTLSGDLIELQRQLETIEPGSLAGLLKYLEEGYRHNQVSLERFIGRNFYSMLDYFSIKNLPLLFQAKALVKHYANVQKYFKNPRLQAAFTFQDMYLGVSPFDALATYSLLQYTELVEGVWYPIGGMYQVVTSLVSIAEKLGVEFIYQSPVKRIIIENSIAKGVMLENGEKLTADIILANADLPYVYRQLLPDPSQSHKLQKKKYTCSTIMFYWGLDKVFPQVQHHNVFLSDDYRGSFSTIFDKHSLPVEPSFYVHAPTRTDPTAAPPGEDTLFVLVPVGHLADEVEQDWSTMIRQARAAVFDRLSKLGMENLSSHIKFEILYSPHEWQNIYNLEKGATFGLSHNFLQVGYFRPHNRHRNWHNLYFVGSSTHPGGGLPIALLSARLVTQRILAGK